MREIGPLLGATTKDMPKHIQGGATRQRADFAISLGVGADFGLGRVEKSLWWAHTTALSSPNPGQNLLPPNP